VTIATLNFLVLAVVGAAVAWEAGTMVAMTTAAVGAVVGWAAAGAVVAAGAAGAAGVAAGAQPNNATEANTAIINIPNNLLNFIFSLLFFRFCKKLFGDLLNR